MIESALHKIFNSAAYVHDSQLCNSARGRLWGVVFISYFSIQFVIYFLDISIAFKSSMDL